MSIGNFALSYKLRSIMNGRSKTLTEKEFDQLYEELTKAARSIQLAKRPGYTLGNADVLHNFKSVATRTGISPGQALAVYLMKHVDAIISALAKPHLPQAEPIQGRFADLINYAHLGYALLQEGEQAKPAEEPVSVGAYGFLPGGKVGG